MPVMTNGARCAIADSRVLCGKWCYTSREGEVCEDDFYIVTCGLDHNDDAQVNDKRLQAKRVNDYNEQLTDAHWSLLDRGCKNIRFLAITPSPIF